MAHTHHHGHDHGHAHSHSHDDGGNARRLVVVLVLTALYMLAEAIGGWLSHSLALIADAGHMLSDVAALGLSLFAVWISRRPPTPARSYGYHRTEILAALANAATLIAISVWVCVEAYHRLNEPHTIAGRMVMAIAAGGFLINVAGMWVLSGGRALQPQHPRRLAARRHRRTGQHRHGGRRRRGRVPRLAVGRSRGLRAHRRIGVLVRVGAAHGEPGRPHGRHAERYRPRKGARRT